MTPLQPIPRGGGWCPARPRKLCRPAFHLAVANSSRKKDAPQLHPSTLASPPWLSYSYVPTGKYDGAIAPGAPRASAAPCSVVGVHGGAPYPATTRTHPLADEEHAWSHALGGTGTRTRSAQHASMSMRCRFGSGCDRLINKALTKTCTIHAAGLLGWRSANLATTCLLPRLRAFSVCHHRHGGTGGGDAMPMPPAAAIQSYGFLQSPGKSWCAPSKVFILRRLR